MLRKIQISLGVVLGAAVLAWGAAPASADHFKTLTNKHTNYGVSQFNHVNVSVSPPPAVRYMNPIHVYQAVATFAYTRATTAPEDDTEREVYLDCRVDLLSPHASIHLPAPAAPGISYLEMIAAPVFPVDIKKKDGSTVQGRVANGLGIGSTTLTNPAGMIKAVQADPRMFSLPDNFLPGHVGQQIDAILCVCAGLNAAGLPADMFDDFGVNNCP